MVETLEAEFIQDCRDYWNSPAGSWHPATAAACDSLDIVDMLIDAVTGTIDTIE